MSSRLPEFALKRRLTFVTLPLVRVVVHPSTSFFCEVFVSNKVYRVWILSRDVVEL